MKESEGRGDPLSLIFRYGWFCKQKNMPSQAANSIVDFSCVQRRNKKSDQQYCILLGVCIPTLKSKDSRVERKAEVCKEKREVATTDDMFKSSE